MSDTNGAPGRRPEVLNAARASNAEVPRSGAVAHQLNKAAGERASAAASSGQVSEWHRERAWTRLGMARHGEGVGDSYRFDRMTASERGIERHHAGVNARGAEARAEGGKRVAREMAHEKAPPVQAPAPNRRRVVVSDAGTAAQNTSRLAQERAQASSRSLEHAR